MVGSVDENANWVLMPTFTIADPDNVYRIPRKADLKYLDNPVHDSIVPTLIYGIVGVDGKSAAVKRMACLVEISPGILIGVYLIKKSASKSRKEVLRKMDGKVK